jgi:hypothetical protein
MVAGVGPLQILRMPKPVFRHFFRVNWVAFPRLVASRARITFL